MTAEIPYPITFNPYKHHFRFLLDEIKKWRNRDWKTINKGIISIGNNLIDFYTGDLSIEKNTNEILEYFTKFKVHSRDDFIKWLNSQDWRKVKLSDQSEWLIKQGDDENRYIHIHPAKYSKHTIRVRATTLKTVLALEILFVQKKPSSKRTLEAVNEIRTKRLDLSPIKSLQKSESGILRLWEIFQSQPLI